MSLHANWNYTIDDLAKLAKVPASVFNVYESLMNRHPNAKIVVRCMACGGDLLIAAKVIKQHHFQKNAQPSISCNCPNCKKQLTSQTMQYKSVVAG